uniref:nucleotidyltransferase domain-containing protein n=1 Tax=Hominenteromicrobium sp. TaxID=3073581 RepID=UPI003AB715B4
MKLNAAIKNMTTQIADVLSLNDPSVYIYGSYVLDDFQYGWSDIDILVLTQKSISEQQANELVCLRQSITAAESDNPFYRCFEGGMLTLNAFIRKVPDRVVYWETSGQRITDSYHFDACCMKELLDYSRLLHGKDIRGQLTPPSFEDIKTNIQFHYDTIRKYASST